MPALSVTWPAPLQLWYAACGVIQVLYAYALAFSTAKLRSKQPKEASLTVLKRYLKIFLSFVILFQLLWLTYLHCVNGPFLSASISQTWEELGRRYGVSRNKPKFHLARYVTWRACRAVLFQHGDDEEAAVLGSTSLVFCALDLHQSREQLLEKVRWKCPPQSTLLRRPWTRVVNVAPVVTSVSRRTVRPARHVSSLFPLPKSMG